MTVDEIMCELEALGAESIKKVLVKHGAREPFFGVRVGDMKPIVKRIKVNHDLALGLYRTGNTDAMYLAGLIADDARMTESELQEWADAAYWPSLSESIVPWVATGNPKGYELALGWIESEREQLRIVGWATLLSIVSVKSDSELDIEGIDGLLDRVGATLLSETNRLRYIMNGFVIAVGSYVGPLSDRALEVAERIGKVTVDMGDTSCKVRYAPDVIREIMAKGLVGKKRKSAKC